MVQAWRSVLLLSLVLCYGLVTGFSDVEAEAARDSLAEVVDAALATTSSHGDELELPPTISEEVRRVAFVKVDTIKEVKNIKLTNLGSLRRAGPFSVDPIVPGDPAVFTLPLELNALNLTGDLVRKVNDVGPTGHFHTTIGVYKLEASGLAEVPNATSCRLNINMVHSQEMFNVDTTVQGASLLNRPLASETNTAVQTGKLPVREQVSREVWNRLQEELDKQDCGAVLQRRLAAVPATTINPARDVPTV